MSIDETVRADFPTMAPAADARGTTTHHLDSLAAPSDAPWYTWSGGQPTELRAPGLSQPLSSLGPPGTRYWHPTTRGHTDALYVEWQDASVGSLSPEDIPLLLSTRHSVKRSNAEGRKRLHQSSVTLTCDEERCCVHHARDGSHVDKQHLPRLSSILNNKLAPPKLAKAAKRAQKQVSTSGAARAHAAKILSADDTRSDHPLSGLRWPFDDAPSNVETKRGGGGGGSSQPSTTGSQGFPQFVTAGPNVSLFGHNLFGYDSDDISGNISWA